MTYKTLEQQIMELWDSRGLKVVEIKVEPLPVTYDPYKNVVIHRLSWTITAEEKEPEKKEESEKR